jgi:hypothetical protein
MTRRSGRISTGSTLWNSGSSCATLLRGLVLFDASLIRFLGRKLTEEKDPQKVEELAATLRSVISLDAQEARLRLQFLLQRHPQLADNLPDPGHPEDREKP